MPFVCRHVRATGGSIPEARRGGTFKKAAGGSKGSRRRAKKAQADGAKQASDRTGKGSLTEAKKAEITAALLAKWEQEGIGSRRKAPGRNPGVGAVSQRDGVRARLTSEPRPVARPQPDKAKKAANARRRSAQAKHPSLKNAKTKERKSDSRQPITEKEAQQLELRLPGVGGLLAFFSAAGVRVEAGRRGSLWINGRQTPPLARIRPSPGTPGWNSVIDAMALKYAGDKFIKAIEDNAHFGEGLRAFLRPHEKAFAIMRGDVRLATIHATRAYIPHREVIHANFLKPGTQWQQIADALHSAEAELMAEWKHKQEETVAAEAVAAAAEAQRKRAAARQRIDLLPDDLTPELIEACLDASRRIRLERQVAYERPVILEYDLGELTLLPIAGTATRLLMPFRLSMGSETLNGELVLADRDPLPLLIGEDVADQDVITAWTCALLGFADATCIELEPASSVRKHEQARPRWRPSSSAQRYRPSTRSLPRKQPWPAHLEPVGHWVHYSGSFVAGHRRRLNDGQTASEEARDRARQVGIILKENETWVRPHARGIPHSIEMRFLWHAPTELKLPTRSL
ncbi:MAG TPA: hypothetical protein VMV92_33645 [Streptosporangiaceae bacterium]|nr:hypothetical protein [Streptosporangiaceae bacterium]